MKFHYSIEKNVEMLLSLMKTHNIKRIVISPGATNVTFVASVQQDPYFMLYSAPDERSAAYMAGGLAAELQEPVALSCTGATASRNYVPGLTEAFYRKLPILAITSSQPLGRVGQYMPQMLDRSCPMKDLVNLSVRIPVIHDEEDAWAANVAINKAMLELRHRGGGPAHIDLVTSFSQDFSVQTLPQSRAIFRVGYGDSMPELIGKKVAVFVGNHGYMSNELTEAIERFCLSYHAIVICDWTSNYRGKYAISASLVTSQDMHLPDCVNIDTMIHIGSVSGAYLNIAPKEVWRINPDGEVRDTFRKLKYIFEMEEVDFFKRYTERSENTETENFYSEWMDEDEKLRNKIKDIPFSNIWMAQMIESRLPSGSSLYLGILNSLRAWNFCRIRQDIRGFSNTGGFGIDGPLSTLVGGALANPKRLHFEVLGDLAFFYDMNALGNRHVSPSIRILLINNGKGIEFRNYNHPGAAFGEEADQFIAAGGHYGNKSHKLVKHYAEDLGFIYLHAENKKEFLDQIDNFCSPQMMERPIVFEVFTTDEAESEALRIMRNLSTSQTDLAKKKAKEATKGILGKAGYDMLKRIMKK